MGIYTINFQVFLLRQKAHYLREYCSINCLPVSDARRRSYVITLSPENKAVEYSVEEEMSKVKGINFILILHVHV